LIGKYQGADYKPADPELVRTVEEKLASRVKLLKVRRKAVTQAVGALAEGF
jgi:hypothetical protein